jgi:peptidoglycan/xylan/chitin deacetylase (PgdA/CDA1 family)
VLALTFDACEGPTRATLDQPIVDYLEQEKIPFTVFMGGRFARDNAKAVRALGAYRDVEIENHSFSHPQDMRALDDERIRSEVSRAQAQILTSTGRTTRLFRFPAGKADERTVAVVEAMGYRVVHWRFPSGDPDPALSAEAILKDTLARVRPGDILIFHINGRGVHTAEILPLLVAELRRRGYRFTRLDDALGLPAASAGGVH